MDVRSPLEAGQTFSYLLQRFLTDAPRLVSNCSSSLSSVHLFHALEAVETITYAERSLRLCCAERTPQLLYDCLSKSSHREVGTDTWKLNRFKRKGRTVKQSIIDRR